MTTDVTPVAADRSASVTDPAAVMVVLGAVFVVAGGLVAAVTRPLDVELGSWLAAYLVLICGVTQYLIGRAQPLVAATAPGVRVGVTELACWNAGNALVVVGTLVAVPWLVDLGSVALLVALVTALVAVNGSRHRWRWAYRVALLVVAVGVPIGSLLAHLRHG